MLGTLFVVSPYAPVLSLKWQFVGLYPVYHRISPYITYVHHISPMKSQSKSSHFQYVSFKKTNPICSHSKPLDILFSIHFSRVFFLTSFFHGKTPPQSSAMATDGPRIASQRTTTRRAWLGWRPTVPPPWRASRCPSAATARLWRWKNGMGNWGKSWKLMEIRHV